MAETIGDGAWGDLRSGVSAGSETRAERAAGAEHASSETDAERSETCAAAHVPLTPGPSPRRGEGGRDDALGEVGVDEAFEGLEGAFVFLAIVGVAAQVAALFGQELGGDARDLGGGDFDAGPVGAAVGPGFIEEAAPAVRGREANQAAARDGQHGPDAAIKLVGDAGGLVDDEHMDLGKAANRIGLTGKADDAAAMGERTTDCTDHTDIELVSTLRINKSAFWFRQSVSSVIEPFCPDPWNPCDPWFIWCAIQVSELRRFQNRVQTGE